MTAPPSDLYDVPDGIAESASLLADLDRCFEHGFSRLNQDSIESLDAATDTFTGTPLAARLDTAVDDISQSQFEPDAFEALAAARTSLQGARYDALVDHVCEIYGWSRPAVTEPTPQEPTDEVATLLESTQQWLTEVAIAGFGALEADTIDPFEPTLRKLKTGADTRRLATLLSGFVRELQRNTPTASMESVPITRWVDCWSRAMVHATSLPGEPDSTTVTGRLRLLGSDLRHHETTVSVVAYGLFEGDDTGTRFVRTSISTGTVDAIAGNRLWRQFPDSATPLLTALAENKLVHVEDAELQTTGDLLLTGTTTPGEDCDKLDLADEYFADPTAIDLTLPDQHPIDRHPAQIAVPTYLSGYEVDDSSRPFQLTADDSDDDTTSLILDVERISPYSGIDVDHVLGSKRLGGLLRFDGGHWTVQPLVETKRSKRVYTALDAEPEKHSDLAESLHDRADALLREKS